MTPEEAQELKEKVKALENIILQLVKSNRYTVTKNLQISDTRNIQLGKNTGTKIGTETSQKVGFFNKTPVIQQTTTSQTPATFVANTSGISNDTATWGGYTVGDIVAILQALGLIA